MRLTGKAAQQVIAAQIRQHSGAIDQTLAPLEPSTAVLHWFDTIRAIEEFINFPVFSIDDDELARRILEFPLHRVQTDEFASLRAEITAVLDEGVARRFGMIALQAFALGRAYAMHGIVEPAMMLQTVAGAMEYFQSRRRHFVAMLYTLPIACRGAKPVERLDTLNLFAPQIELYGLSLTALHNQAMLSDVFSDFHIETDGFGGHASHAFEPLDGWYLEPERASIVEMIEGGAGAALDLEPQDPRLVFSAAETRNDIRQLKAAYSEFGLADSDFGCMVSFFIALLDHCQDDYRIDVDRATFETLIADAEKDGARGLMHVVANQSGDYVRNTNEYAPIVRCGDRYFSAVTLVTRFLNHWKNVCLNKDRRFQIRSGFIFEESVKRKLTEQGFAVQDIKRIDRKEFDVVATDGDVVYNIQCKNNLVDLTRVESDRKRFARYNRYLDSYYARSLAKEEGREHLLLERLSLQTIKHFVISRFPVATTNARVLPYSKIDQFRALAVSP